MANMQWSQLRPIHDAAAALDGVADDATTDEVGHAVTAAISHLAEALNRLELSDRGAAQLIPDWKRTSVDVREAINTYSSEIARRLLDANRGKPTPVVIDTGSKQIVCTPRVSKRRTDVERDELAKAVERAAREPVNRLNPNGTGELLDHAEAKVLLLKQCFRLEPRWTELKKLGVNDDEYCKHETMFALDIREGGSL